MRIILLLLSYDRDKRQTGGESGEDLNLEVHLPALPAAAMTTRETKQMIVLLTTDKTHVAAGPRSFTLTTDMLTHVTQFIKNTMTINELINQSMTNFYSRLSSCCHARTTKSVTVTQLGNCYSTISW